VTVAWGLLSTARINLLVLEAAAESDRAEVIAVASRGAERAEEYAREHEIPRAYGSYEALLEDPDVEAVYISLPNALHVPWTLRALEAGKHVLCEKPFSREPEQVERCFELADSKRLVLSEGFMWRHHPQTKKLATLAADGAVGRLRLVRAAFSFQAAATHGAGDTRFDPELAGGSLMDVGSYCVNAIRLLAGEPEPERVQGEQVVGESGVDVCFAGILRCPGDVVAHFDCGFVLPYRAALEVVGEDGSLVVGDPWHAGSPGIELRRKDERQAERIAIEPANSYRLELDDLCAAIRGEAAPLLGRDDALGQARTIDGLYRSAARAGPVELPIPSSHGSAS
jgi:D-xylose 1-dehydrogenase (NADP+, D-xylono-1,5-lactone-forming)